MAGNTEQVSTVTIPQPASSAVSPGQEIDDATYKSMLDILDSLTSHTHIFYDDYGTNCNCNCACDCTRGTV